MLQWSPDSKSLVAFRIEPGDDKEVYLVESSPAGGGRAKLHSRPYRLPGDKLTAFELNLFRRRNEEANQTGRRQRSTSTSRNIHWIRTAGTSPTKKSTAVISGCE